MQKLAHRPRQQRPIPAPCRFYAQGRCRDGDQCRFSHDAPPPAPATRARPDAEHRLPAGVVIPCRYFAQGRCQKGDACPFTHDSSMSPTSSSQVEPEPGGGKSVDARPSVPCSFYARGSCERGEQCPFAHIPKDGSPAGIMGEAKESLRPDDWIRNLDGTLVRFGDGAQVLKLNLPSDFSAVHLSNLPADSTNYSVAATLAQLGFTVHLECIRVCPDANNKNQCAADVRLEDPLFAKKFCAKVRAQPDGKTNREFDAIAANIPLPKGSHSARVDCKKVHLSWEARRRMMLGRFERLQRDVGMGEMNAVVKSLLTHVGQLDYWQDAPETSVTARAQARFRDDEDSQKAAATLNNSMMSIGTRTTKLMVELVYTARMKESEAVYQAVKQELEKKRERWKLRGVLFIPYPASKGYRVLKLEGKCRENVVMVKKSLDEILAGQMVVDGDGKALWVSSFGAHGKAYRRIKEMGKELRIAIIRDRRKCQLRLYGAADQRQRAVKELIAVAEEASSASQTIELDQPQFAWACRGGFRAVAAALADAAVTFDIISTPKKIHIMGSEEEYGVALKMVQSQIEQPVVPKAAASSHAAPDCSICWTEADNPIHTRCGHDYCSDCFERLCSAASGKSSSSSSSSAVVCEGDMAQCRAVFSLSELQDHLSSSVFEDLLHSSLTSYVRAHPETFRYCPTPGCEKIYRCVTSTPSASSSGGKDNVFVCPSCLVVTCTSCHASHAGMTCAEHKDASSGGLEALARAKVRLGIKDCPSCTTPIEKTEGCDHMTCIGCKVHICWRCLDTFKSAGECYGHMNNKHGGAGLEHGGRRIY